MLASGTEAFMVVSQQSGSRSRSGKRARLVGAARVRVVESRGDIYRVEVIAGSGVSEGFPLDATREELFVTPAERIYFKQLVDFLWGGIPKTMERPPIDDE